MSRAIRIVMLVSVASALGACSESPTGPAPASPSPVVAPRQSPVKANPDGVCDYINPWARC